MEKYPKNTLIVGSTGFLGSLLLSKLQSAIGWDRNIIDLAKPISPLTIEKMKTDGIQFMVICGGITNVEDCFQNRDLSNRVNVTGTIELLKVAQSLNITPIFFSSDYVFSESPGPHHEKSVRAPKTIYGQQKLSVELFLEENFDRYLIFRTSKLMSKHAHPKNILFPIIRDLGSGKQVHAFEDQWLNPVFIEDIPQIVKAACSRDLNGDYNLGTRRIFTRSELAKFLASSVGYDPNLIRSIKMSDIQFSEVRPHHNTLDCNKISSALGIRFTELEDVAVSLRSLVL